MNRTPLLGFGMAVVIVAGAFLMMQRPDPAASAPEPAATGVSAGDAGAAGATTTAGLPGRDAASQDGRVVQVWKSPTCGCCTKWIEHLETAGFVVEAHDVADPTAVKNQYGVPASVRSCHTALVDGYLVEGHVPAGDLERLLEERPQVAGVAVPGMPIGSPGMEVGDRKDPYDVLTFAGDGTTKVYSSH